MRSFYIFFRGETPTQGHIDDRIRSLQTDDCQAVMALDRVISQEDRASLLEPYLNGGWVFTGLSGDLEGFYLPIFADGLVLARDQVSGNALLDFKLSQGSTQVVVPESNVHAMRLIEASGFTETGRSTRMEFGLEVAWNPEGVYSRAAGWCG